MEQKLDSSGNPNNIYGSADSLICQKYPFLHVANFSTMPIIVPEGQLMGTSRNPDSWLDKERTLSTDQQVQMEIHCNLIRSLLEKDPTTTLNSDIFTVRSESEISSKVQQNTTEPDNPALEDP
jgi:hypothetical protein